MKPTLSVRIHRPARLPEEPSVFSLLLSNPSTDDLIVPLPALQWWRDARMRVTRPDGTTAFFRLGDSGPPASGQLLTLWEEAELEHEVSLDGLVPDIRAPGEYSLDGILDSIEGAWPIAPVRWLVEEPRPILASAPPSIEPGDEAPTRGWTVTLGSRRSVLALRDLTFDDTEGPKLTASVPEDVCAVVPRRPRSRLRPVRRAGPRSG